MNRMEPRYLLWTSKAFQIAREIKSKNRPESAKKVSHLPRSETEYESERLTILELYLAAKEGLGTRKEFCSMSRDAVVARCQETEVHLAARCGFFWKYR